MKFLRYILALGITLVNAAQTLPENEGIYRLADLNPFLVPAFMTPSGQDVRINPPATSDSGKLSQQWIVKDLNTQDNTTALWNVAKKQYAGYEGDPKFDSKIILVDNATRFALIAYERVGFQIAVPGAREESKRLVMSRGPAGRSAQVVLRYSLRSAFQSWNFTTPP